MNRLIRNIKIGSICLFLSFMLLGCNSLTYKNYSIGFVEALENGENLDEYISEANEVNIHVDSGLYIEGDIHNTYSAFEAMCYYNPDLALYMIDKGYVNEKYVTDMILKRTLESESPGRFRLFNKFLDSYDLVISNDELSDFVSYTCEVSLNEDESVKELSSKLTIKLFEMIDIGYEKYNETLDKIMFVCAECENLELLEYFYSHYDINLNEKIIVEPSNLEDSLLHFSARLGRYNSVKWLVNHGADIHLICNSKTAYEECLENYNFKSSYLTEDYKKEYEKTLNYLKTGSLERAVDKVGGVIEEFLEDNK